jgi:2-keto-4-pentenoate hydratase/2-oxohepta-3-ene-1,7-dioic acid hydratase in catechol pathway
MRQDTHVDTLGVFLKAPSSLVPHGGVVQLPYHDRRFDQEGELALVMGREMSDVPPEKALDYVAGYTCLLDMTMRGGEDRSLRKSFDTFTPMGPHLVTPDEVGPLEALELRCSVDGTLRQDARIADLIWDVPRLLSYASSAMRLLPGDVVSTGTPAGVGEVRDGHRIVVEIDRVGRLEVTVSSAGAVASPTRGDKVPHAVAAAPVR